MPPELLVVKPHITRDLWPDEVGQLISFILLTQFYLGDDKSLVVADKLIYLDDVVAAAHEVACLLHHTRFA